MESLCLHQDETQCGINALNERKSPRKAKKYKHVIIDIVHLRILEMYLCHAHGVISTCVALKKNITTKCNATIILERGSDMGMW